MKFTEVRQDDWCGLSGLIGKPVEYVELSDCKTLLRFQSVEGAVTWRTEGDCCSESWIEHVTMPYFFEAGAKVIKIEEIDLGEVMPTRQEHDRLYGIKIHFDVGGSLFLEFRNSSNGYYGGTMRACDPNRQFTENFAKVEKDL